MNTRRGSYLGDSKRNSSVVTLEVGRPAIGCWPSHCDRSRTPKAYRSTPAKRSREQKGADIQAHDVYRRGTIDRWWKMSVSESGVVEVGLQEGVRLEELDSKQLASTPSTSGARTKALGERRMVA